ncbi:hypothetical protein BDV59DRAFT_171544 [Aspergillus ambiguus]|uniref:TPR domain protein n=1 Tax=Aspergillus ambiguus TaxID=176160 RepID=UPI003CCDEA76
MFTTASRRVTAVTLKARNLTLFPHQPRLLTTRSISRPRPNSLQTPGKPHLTPHNASSFQQTRQSSYFQRMKRGFQEASKGIWRKNPILLPVAILSLAGATAIFTYIAYVEYTTVAPQYSRFPPPVESSLRTAVYYTEVDLQPPRALKAYKEALRIAVEMGMHPFSDEVLGIKLQVAMMLEKAGLVKPAVDVLERTKTEALNWIEDSRKQAAVREKERLAAKDQPEKVEVTDPEMLDLQEQMKQRAEWEDRQRDKALKKAVGIEMKLAELYSSDYIQDDAKAEAAQVAAVEMCLKEMQRRQTAGLPVGGGSKDNDAWLNLGEMCTALAELADTYRAQGKFDLALPLYLRSLDLARADDGDCPTCKQAVLLCDISGVLANRTHQPIQAPEPDKVRTQMLENAGQWAQKAIEVSAKIKPPVRDWDCDIASTVATYNLGTLAADKNKQEEAKRLFTKALSDAQALGYPEGIEAAEESLKKLKENK